jgi:hypothetical protein
MRGRHIVFAIVLLCVTSGVAWAGKKAYKLVMSQDKDLCAHMLAIFNADMKKERALLYEEHKEFVVWEPIDPGRSPSDSYCRQELKQIFDINNDGTDELVIRTRHCFQSQLADDLYIFPLHGNAIELLKDPKSQVLSTTEDRLNAMTYDLTKMPGIKSVAQAPGLHTIITLEPFKFKGTFYVSMTDLRQEFIVIAKYLHGEQRDDVCYFRGKPLV